MLVAGFWMLGARCWVFVDSSRFQVPGSKLFQFKIVADYRLLQITVPNKYNKYIDLILIIIFGKTPLMKIARIILFLTLHILLTRCTVNPELPAGYPDRSPEMDVLPGFRNPPKGYGEVPFYWWQGDTLTKERLLWQLDQLTGKKISSLQINYSHLDYGGLSYGWSNPSKPALFSDAWWDLFKWFAAEARKRGMTVSLSDYTIGIGQGFSMDEALKNNPDMNGSVLKHASMVLKGKVDIKPDGNILSVTAYKFQKDSTLIPESRQDLISLISNGRLISNLGDTARMVIIVYSEKLVPSYDPLHPKSGESYNKYFFGKFEEALQGQGSDALNFFFSDELNFRVSGNLWNGYFADEFRKRKGYDIIPNLDALFANTGPDAPKIRIDYNDVLVSLSEENFFKPVYQWHQDRGMIFGCDHGGRGRDVAEFGDYFRTQRWNQGPGSDQPYLSKDIVKAKVAASIAHLYERPRVWLEGFHSSGWGTSSAALTDAILANYVAGYNLMSFHGLYYSTMGGWWEWAPPDNHFRNPFWQQAGPLMECTESLSYLLSQGVHRCDVGILYPTEPVIAGIDGEKAVKTAFRAGENIYSKGIDFDYIDYESLAKCEIKDKMLHVSGEQYKVLVIPSMKIIRHSSLMKIKDFIYAGGLVVCIGSIPEITEQNGAINEDIKKQSSSVFSGKKNVILITDPEETIGSISGRYEADFSLLTDVNNHPYVMHRVIGERDVYALYNFPKGSRCFFSSKGNVQLWNPWTGKTSGISSFCRETEKGTEVELPLTEKEIQIIVFGNKNKSDNVLEKREVTETVSIDGSWEFELKPSLDNKWGDYQLPAKKEMLGAQVRQIWFKELQNYSGEEIRADSTWRKVTCSFGSQFMKLGPLKEKPSADKLLKITGTQAGSELLISGKKYKWEEYSFSWRYGVEGDYGHQGWHGLKGSLYDEFIRLGDIEEVKMSRFRVPEKGGNYYVLQSSVIAPYDGEFDILSDSIKPSLILINGKQTDKTNIKVTLNKGANQVVLLYDKACTAYLVFRIPEAETPERKPVAMRWYGDTGILPFDFNLSGLSTGIYRFKSAPGLKSLAFKAYGNLKVWIDGSEQKINQGEKRKDGLTDYVITVKDINPGISDVTLKIDYQPGYRGAAAIPEYIEQECGEGVITLGDWSEIDGLRAYSGGVLYSKTISIDEKELSGKTEIDLGELVSSAELFINGKSAGIRVSPPWKFDITGYVKAGENRIEVLVYNTLANNYTSIPTRYRGSIRSGLIGPVTMNHYDSSVK